MASKASSVDDADPRVPGEVPGDSREDGQQTPIPQSHSAAGEARGEAPFTSSHSSM